MSKTKKPVVDLTRYSDPGNPALIIGACMKAARRAGWPEEKLTKVVDEMKSGDADNVLRVAMKHFEVEA